MKYFVHSLQSHRYPTETQIALMEPHIVGCSTMFQHAREVLPSDELHIVEAPARSDFVATLISDWEKSGHTVVNHSYQQEFCWACQEGSDLDEMLKANQELVRLIEKEWSIE